VRLRYNLRMFTRFTRATIAAALLATGACAAAAAGPAREITVAAAASLTVVFQRIGAAFEHSHPGDHVRFTFSASNTLATQIREGAPIDVFASAAPAWLDAVAKDPGLLARASFARNRLIVIVPRDNPAHIVHFADLARAGVRLVVAAPGVPAGDYARRALTNAGLRPALRNVVSNEQDVEGVVAKVVSGDADAGIVYATDVTAAIDSSVRTVTIPEDDNVIAVYEIGVVRGSKAAGLARAFMSYVLGAGRTVLTQAGFAAPL
jgi:molybdate transport system substrate-binding protein